jgi:hypothetical protein
MRVRAIAFAGILAALAGWWLWPLAEWRELPPSARRAVESLPPVAHLSLPAPPASWQEVRYGPVSLALPATEMRSAFCLEDRFSCRFLLDGYEIFVDIESPAHGGISRPSDGDTPETFTVRSPALRASRSSNRLAVQLGRMISDAQAAGMLTDLRAATFEAAGTRGILVRNRIGGWAALYPEASSFQVTLSLIRRRALPQRFLPILGSVRLAPERLSGAQLAADAAAIEARWPHPHAGSGGG